MVTWTEAIDNFWDWLRENGVMLLMASIIIALIIIVITAGGKDALHHRAKCDILLSQQKTAQDSIHIYQFDSYCVVELKK